MRHFIPALALAAVLATPALATNDRPSGFTGFGAFGSFTTSGGAAAGTIGNGMVEAYGAGGAGIEAARQGRGFRMSGWHDNQAGSNSTGNAAGAGWSNGEAGGVAGVISLRARPSRFHR
jgi:hypothetical protein